MTEAESIEFQTAEWVAGRPWHNTVRDECCPDFSCCQAELLWGPVLRAWFAALPDDSEERSALLMSSLGALFSHTGIADDIYVVGGGECDD